MQAPTTSTTRGGFTLIEAILSLGLLTVFFGSVALVFVQSNDAYTGARATAELQRRLERAMTRVSDNLVGTSLGVLNPDPTDSEFGEPALTFRKVTGYGAGAPIFGNELRLLFEYEEGELDDGVDNNGNGLVDEGVLVLRRDFNTAEERRIVLCHGVAELAEGEALNVLDDNGNGLKDERGFCVVLVDEVLTAFLTVEALGPEGERMQRSMSTAVRLRN